MESSSTSDREAMRAWVANWKVVGEELDRMKWEELRAMTEDDAARKLNLQDWPFGELWRSPERERAEGMIEHQRLLMKGYGVSPNR